MECCLACRKITSVGFCVYACKLLVPGTKLVPLVGTKMALLQRSSSRINRRRTGDLAGSLPRAVRILKHLAGTTDSLTIRAMSDALDIPNTTLHRVINSLVQLQLLEVTEAGLYTWGPELRTIASAVVRKKELNILAGPVLREI